MLFLGVHEYRHQILGKTTDFLDLKNKLIFIIKN